MQQSLDIKPLVQIFKTLNPADPLHYDHLAKLSCFKTICPYQLRNFNDCLDTLNEHSLLAHTNIKRLKAAIDYSSLIHVAINFLAKEDLLDSENFMTISAKPAQAITMAGRIKLFQDEEILTAHSHHILRNSSETQIFNFISLLKILHTYTGLDSRKNKETLLKNIIYIQDIHHSLINLGFTYLTTQYHFDVLIQFLPYTERIPELIVLSHNVQIPITSHHIEVLKRHHDFIDQAYDALLALHSNELLTLENFDFLLQDEFCTCFCSIARAIVLLNRVNKLDSQTKQELKRHPHHALVFAMKLSRHKLIRINPIDNQMSDISLKCCILQQGERNNKRSYLQFFDKSKPSLLSKIDISLLSKIAFLSSSGNIDEKTGVTIGNISMAKSNKLHMKFLEKRKELTLKRRNMLILSSSLGIPLAGGALGYHYGIQSTLWATILFYAGIGICLSAGILATCCHHHAQSLTSAISKSSG